MSLRGMWFVLKILLIASGIAPSVGLAQEPSAASLIQAPGSWRWVPEQADFFWGIHHVDQQIEATQNSQLAKEIYETSFWKKSNELFLKEWKDRKSDLAVWKARLDNPATREIRAFLYDVISQDIFLYADENLSRTVEQWNSIVPEVERLSSRQTASEDKPDIVARWVNELVPQIQLPTLMLAGRCTNSDRALARIDELEGAVRLGMNFVPDIASLFKTLRRVEDKRGNRLEWRLTADMIPWNQIPETDVLDRETLQDLRSACKDKSIVVSIGLLDEYFCVVFSGDKDWESRFGKDSHVIEHPEIKPLVSQYIPDQVGKSGSGKVLVTSTYHTSDKVVSAFQGFLLDGFFRKIARSVLLPIIDQQPTESDTAAWLVSVLDDASWLDDRIGQHVVRYRGASRVAWLSEEGFESVQIDRTPMHLMDSSQVLEGIRRVGDDPLLILNMRLVSHPEYFVTAREIVRRIKSSFEELMLIKDPQADLGPLKPIHQQLKGIWPLVVSITEDWQKRILPNLNGEHMVLVQSGGLQSKNWLPTLGQTTAPLPLPEAALVSGVSNPDDLGFGTISMVNSIGSMLGSFGIYPPVPPSLNQTDGWSLGTLPQTWGKADVGTFQGILATGERWNWLGYSRAQWQSFVEADKRPLDHAVQLLGFQEANGPLASAALIDLGRLSRLENLWIAEVLEKAPVDTDGNLVTPATASGRRLLITPAELKEFLACTENLGRLTSFSKSDAKGGTLSRSRYDWKAR